MRRCFFTISLMLLVWACGVSNVDHSAKNAPSDAHQIKAIGTDPQTAPAIFKSASFEKSEYPEIRALIRPGDVIAFSGGTFASRLVMAVTGSNVSHVGLVVPTTLLGEPSEGPVVAEVTEQGVIFSALSDVIEGGSDVLWWLPLQERPAPERVTDAVRTHRGKSYDYQQSTWLVLEPLAPAFADAGPVLKADISRILTDMIVPPLREKLLMEIPEEVPRPLVEDFVSEARIRSAVSEAIEEHLELTLLMKPYVSRLQNQEDSRKLFCSEFVADVLKDSGVIRDIVASQTTPIELCMLDGIYAQRYVQFKGSEAEKIKYSVSVSQ